MMYTFSKWFGDQKESYTSEEFGWKAEDEVAYCLDNGWMVEYVYGE